MSCISFLPKQNPKQHFRESILLEQKTHLKDPAGLIFVRSRGTKGPSWGETGRLNPGKVCTGEEALVLICWSQRDGPAAAAWTVQQIDRLFSQAPRTRDVFSASGQRETMQIGVTRQHCATPRRCPVQHPDTRIGGHIAVLKIRLNDPAPLRVGIYGRIHEAVVLHRCGQSLECGLTQVSHTNE